MKILILLLFINPLFSFEEWLYIVPTKEKINIEKIQLYNFLSITGFYLNENGDLITKTSSENFKTINQKIFPLITFTNINEGKKLLSNEKSRKKAINHLVDLTEKENYPGVHIDFEYLSKKEVKFFKEFLENLQKELHKKNKILTAALFPQIWDMKYKEFHNLEIIYPFIDEVVLMSYDYHNPKTKPGPVSEYNWVKENIKEFIKFFKPSQIWLGIPLYGYEWNHKVKIVDSKYFQKILNSNFKKEIYNDINFGTKIIYHENGFKKVLYFPNEDFQKRLKKLAEEFQLKGVAYWRFGF